MRKTIQACRSTASFIDKQIERDIDEDRDSHSFQDSDAESDDQENAVYTLAKGQHLDTFIKNLTEEQNRLFLTSSGKYFVPTLLCNLASDLSASCLMILRNCDLLQNYQLYHMKHSRVCENFRLVDFSLMGTESVTWKD